MKKKFVILFVSSLIIFSVFNILNPSREFSETENRYLALKPEFSLKSLFKGDYTEKFENYVTDQILFRDTFVSLKSNAEKLLGKYENNNIYFCKDEYLINVPPKYDEEALKKNINAINALAGTGKYNVSFSLIPTAYEILKDKLPPYAYTDIQKRVLSYAESNLNNVNFINLVDKLTESKSEYIYYRTDHHQTMHGSYLVYQDIMTALNKAYYEISSFDIICQSEEFYGTSWSKAPINITPDKIIEYKPLFDVEYSIEYTDTGKISDTLYAYENLSKKDKYTYYLGGNNSVVKIKTSVKNGEKLAVIKDSYAHSIIPLIANHYEEIYVVDLRYYNYNPHEFLSKNEVENVLFIYNIENFLSDTNLVKITAYLDNSK